MLGGDLISTRLLCIVRTFRLYLTKCHLGSELLESCLFILHLLPYQPRIRCHLYFARWRLVISSFQSILYMSISTKANMDTEQLEGHGIGDEVN